MSWLTRIFQRSEADGAERVTAAREAQLKRAAELEREAALLREQIAVRPSEYDDAIEHRRRLD